MEGGSPEQETGATAPPESRRKCAGCRVKRLLAGAGGIGFLPFAPGTAASVVAAGLYVAIALLTNGWWLVALLAVVVGIVGVWLGNQAKELFGTDDPPSFVIDEILGMWIAMFGMGGSLPLTWYGVLAAVILFRLFDIVKPYPAGRIDKIKSGWGIMGDDVAAGLYAGIVVRVGWIGWSLLA